MTSPLPGTPLVWSPKGASDTLDSSTAPQGAMALLQNLIPDPTTRNLWQCRPAGISLVNFATAGFNTPTFVSVWKVIGTRIYGMVSTARNLGHDEPFVYDIPSASFIAITGVTNANTPASPQTTGAWTPPSMDIIGANLIIAHPGFNGAGGAFFGVLNIISSAAPTWTAQNTTTNALLAPPQWVQNFNGRCFFLVNPSGAQPAAYMSDELLATSITNANQILTFGDNTTLTCAVGLALQNQLGGIIQSLIVFKSASNLYQVTGDYSLQNLTINTLNVATGTFAPNTVVSTSKGLAFIAPDGLRIIDFNANVGDPIGNNGDGISTPFINALVPSRMCAAYNVGIYRVQVQNGVAIGNPQQQWWYDSVRQLWSGPHTQEAALMAPYAGTFLATLQGAGAVIFQTDPVQSSSSTFVENGAQLYLQFATPMLPDTDQMSEVAVVETTVHLSLVAGNAVVCAIQDQNGTVLDSVTLTTSAGATIWGAFKWGQALWQGLQNALYPQQLAWHFPIVFRRAGLLLQAPCAPGLKIGRIHLRYQVLGYLQEPATGISTFMGVPSIGLVTLTANATQTVIANSACLPTSSIYLMPNTQDAANDMATTSLIAGTGSFTITHANNARLDRTFTYSIFN